MSITIIIDPYGTESSDGVLHVHCRDDYLPAVRRLWSAIDGRLCCVVAVHNPGMFSWFDQFRDRKGIVFSHAEPCHVLAEHLHVGIGELPEELRLDPSVVVSESLLQKLKECPPSPGQSPLSWVLQVTLGSVWMDDHLAEPSQCVSLIAEYLRGRAIENVHPTLLALRNRRVQQWIQSGTPYAAVLTWLFAGNPAHKSKTLLLCRALARYPRTVQKAALAFEGRWGELADLDDAMRVADLLPPSLAAGLPIPAGVTREVEEHLVTSLDVTGLSGVVDSLSGMLPIEQRVIEAYLKAHLSDITDKWGPPLRCVVDIFAASGASNSFCDFVTRLIPIACPTTIPVAAQWKEVRTWIEHEYLPYYHWATAVGKVDVSEPFERSFEGWLLANMSAICRTNGFAPFALRDSIVSVLPHCSVLVVVVDCLSWANGDVLRRALARRGVQCERTSGHLCAIPSETRIAKASLLSGKLFSQITREDDDGNEYGALLAANLGMEPGDIASGTSSKVSLYELLQSPRKLYLYLYNDLDQVIHKALAQDTRRLHIERLIDQLAGDLADAVAAHRIHLNRDISLILCSDHGFTELPTGSVHVVRTPSESAYEVSHNRVVQCAGKGTSPTEELVTIDPAISGDCDNTFFVARGYDVIGSRPRGAVHGGLSPQEVYVPIVASRVGASKEYVDVEVAMTGDIRRGKTHNHVILRLSNPNPVAVSLLDIAVNLTHVSKHGALTIAPNDTLEIPATVDAATIGTARFTATGRMSIDYLGDIRRAEFAFDVETVGAAVTDRAFEEDFDV